MKSEQEIKELIKYEEEQIKFWFENANYTEYNRSYGAIEAFKFILEDSEPKRTIFDLTEEELLELFYTAMPSQRGQGLIFCRYAVNRNNENIEFQLRFNDGHLWIIIIYTNFTMDAYCGGIHSIEKQADYIHKIEEMLSKEATK